MHVFSLSFGKDSMATLILAAEMGIPIDRVMYCDIRFDNNISGEHPIMAEWIPTAEKRLKDLFGIKVDHAYSGVTFWQQFFKEKEKGNHVGDIYGFPYVISAWCNNRLKLRAISRYYKQIREPVTQFVGIAYDEPVRWERMVKKDTARVKSRSLLIEQKLTEQDAMNICRKYELLSPMYEVDGIFRGGCWFCPKQCLADLHSLWKNYPKLWRELEVIEPFSHNTFKPRTTLAELAKRFEQGYVPKRKERSNAVQLDMFDKL